jgi:UDP-3-O-[3-hydroxymyristoyl] glucosamine N-acyltransferase
LPPVKLGELAQQFQLECQGDADVEIRGIANLQEASTTQLAFLFNSKYKEQLAGTKAAAVVLRPEDADSATGPALISDNPRLAWARIASVFDSAPIRMPAIHATAVVSEMASIGRGVYIGPHAIVGGGAVVEDGVQIGAGCQVGEGSIIGAGTRLYPNVVIYHDVKIGAGCIIHGNAVIGADGFGFEFDGSTGDFVKIPQVYGVKIGDDVEIGAGSTIDRGALNHTSIGDGCKLDNQVQIGHGTQIDHHTVISGCTAIAGSTRIGSYCLIGGAVGIVDNIEIVDQVEITAMTLVSQSISEKGRYSSGTGLMQGFEWKRSVVGFRRLDEIIKRLRRLESN